MGGDCTVRCVHLGWAVAAPREFEINASSFVERVRVMMTVRETEAAEE